MSVIRKKKYLFEKNVPLSKYAKLKIRKIVKEQINHINVTDINLDHEVDEDDVNVAPDPSILEESQDILHQNDFSLIGDSRKLNKFNKSNESMQCEYESDHEEESNIDCSSCIINETNFSSDTFEVFQGPMEDDLDSDNDKVSGSDDEISQLLLKEKKKSSSIRDLIDEGNFLKSVTMNVNWSPAELLLMTLQYYLSTSSAVTSLSNLLKLVNRICYKKLLPETRHRIDLLYNGINSITLHSVCLECTQYLGTFENLKGHINCESCNTEVDVSNPSNSCYFAVLDPSDAVRDYLESHHEYYDYVVTERIHEKNHIKDIYDGKLYRKFVKSLDESDRHAYATMTFNTDGAPVFKSSTFSIWPIYGMLNELPVQDRLKSTITIGLWFGSNKPEMGIFLQKFVEVLNSLSIVGIPCMIKNVERKIKLFALVACVDTVARAPMNGSLQFNAHYGCDWCVHPGVYHSGSMRYPFLNPPAEERNRANTIKFIKQSVETGLPAYGIRDASPLLILNGFDIISGFTPDYMHCILAGVGQQFTEYLLKQLSNDEVDLANNILKTIKAPHQLGRLTRPLKDRSNWKAREWENWILYYSVPVLSSILKNKTLLKHWCLLVKALHVCLKMDITYTELNQVNVMLHKFVSEVEIYYDITAMSYNVHQLLHIVKTVHDWGPLWAHSTFPFEAANHRLLKAVHCAKGVILQIVRYNNLQRCVQILEHEVYPKGSAILLDYCTNLKGTLAKQTTKISTITYFGNEKLLNSQTIQHFDLPRMIKVFTKAVINHCLFTTCQKINKRSCNFFAQLQDGSFIQIIQFLVDIDGKKELTICNVLKTRASVYSTMVRQIIEIQNEICIETNQIILPAVFIKFQEKEYIIPIPNCYFY